MSGTGSSEPTFVIDLPALRGLRDRDLLGSGPHSALTWFIEQPVDDDLVVAAIDALRERGSLLPDPERLDSRLHSSFEILTQPLFRLRVVRVTDTPRSVVTYSDGIGAVSLLTDGHELVVTPVQTLDSLVRRITEGIVGSSGSRGPRVDLVGAEVSLLALVAPLAAADQLDAAALAGAIEAIGGEVTVEAADASLVGLVEAGWLEAHEGRFRVADARAPHLEAITALEAIDVITTSFTTDREIHRTHRFQRTPDRVWRIVPFLAGHDHPPAEDASDEATMATLFGLSFVPQSRDMVEAFLCELLGVKRAEEKKKPALGVKLR